MKLLKKVQEKVNIVLDDYGQSLELDAWGDELNKLIAFVQIPFCMFIYVCL